VTAQPLPYDVVLLDLDGTIIDSEPGVQSALRHALVTGFGISPTTAELEEFMGPPLSEVLPRVYGLSDPADEQRFFELYCDVYFHGTETEFDVYPGMLELVRDLYAAGVMVVLATAKPGESAERILEHAGVADCFAFVAGSASDGSRQDKADVIAHAFAEIEADGSTHRIVMVGDRALDVHAARAHGVDSITVSWGYAPAGELDACGATHHASAVGDLRALLLR
jgi:phosphoglycolate phosphatase